jgi:hypothetical protein
LDGSGCVKWDAAPSAEDAAPLRSHPMDATTFDGMLNFAYDN